MTLFDWIYWPLFAAIAAWGLWLLYHAVIGRRNDGRPRCPKCAYDMTGAPSLTCPECGHDAKMPTRQHRRRRSPKRMAVLAVLLATTCWYSLHVRYRLQRDESFWEAMYPTTLLVVNVYPNDDDVWPSRLNGSRWWNDDGSDTLLSAWQLWLRAWVGYHNLRNAPLDTAAGHPAQPWVWPLTEVSSHSGFARWLHGKVIVEHLAEGIRLQAAWEAPDKDNDDLVLRESVWKAIDAGKLDWSDAHHVLVGYGKDQFKHVNDQKFLHEFTTITRPRDPATYGDATELYLTELLRRPSIDRAKELAKVQPGESLLREYLLLTARRRLEGKPDPLRMTLTPSDDGAKVHFKLQNVSDTAITLRWEDEHADKGMWIVQQEADIRLSTPERMGQFYSGGVFGRNLKVELPDQLAAGQSVEASMPVSHYGANLTPGTRMTAHLCFGRDVGSTFEPSAELVTPTTQRSRQDSNLRPAD